jgi:hypothetical protein
MQEMEEALKQAKWELDELVNEMIEILEELDGL